MVGAVGDHTKDGNNPAWVVVNDDKLHWKKIKPLKDSDGKSNITKWFNVLANELKPFDTDGEEKGAETKIPKMPIIPAEVSRIMAKQCLTGWQVV